MRVGTQPFSPVGSHVSNGSISSATTITIPANCNGILWNAKTQNVRYTLDGTTPTASVGHVLLASGGTELLPLGTGVILRVIEETTTAVLNYQFVNW